MKRFERVLYNPNEKLAWACDKLAYKSKMQDVGIDVIRREVLSIYFNAYAYSTAFHLLIAGECVESVDVYVYTNPQGVKSDVYERASVYRNDGDILPFMFKDGMSMDGICMVVTETNRSVCLALVSPYKFGAIFGTTPYYDRIAVANIYVSALDNIELDDVADMEHVVTKLKYYDVDLRCVPEKVYSANIDGYNLQFDRYVELLKPLYVDAANLTFIHEVLN